MPRCYILVGAPCSGKSTWAWKNKTALTVIISRDDVREKLYGKKYDYKKVDEGLVTQCCNTEIDYAVGMKLDIILDNTHCRQKYITAAYNSVPDNYTKIIKHFPIRLWKAYYRNVIRWMRTGKFIPFKVIKNMKKNFDKL